MVQQEGPAELNWLAGKRGAQSHMSRKTSAHPAQLTRPLLFLRNQREEFARIGAARPRAEAAEAAAAALRRLTVRF